MIIDDEPLITKGISSLLTKHNYKCITFNNVASALEYIEHGNHIDIVISDINMPCVNGLSLCEKIKEYQPIEIIMISGYQSFEYAKRSIDINAYKYILKPIKQNELLTAVNELVEIIENRQKNSKNEQQLLKISLSKYISDIANGLSVSELKNETDLLKLPDISRLWVCCVKFPQSTVSTESNLHYLQTLFSEKHVSDIVKIINITEYQKYHFIILFDGNKQDVINLLKSAENSFFCENDIHLPISVCHHVLTNDLRKSIENSITAMHHCLSFDIENWPCVFNEKMKSKITSSNFPISRFYYYISEIVENISQTEHTERTETLINTLFDEYKEYGLLIETIKSTCKNMIYCVYYECQKLFPYQKTEIFENIYLQIDKLNNVISVNKLKNIVTESIGQLGHQLHKYLNDKQIDVKQLVDNMLQNDCTNISLQKAADQLGVSLAYFSTIFKEKTSINFKDYIADYRMDYAKKLLENTTMKISQIAEMAGYADTDYFSRLYKKKYNQTPSETQKIHK